MFSKARVEELEGILKARSGEQTFTSRTFKGTVHGFAIRPNLGIPEVKQAFEEAFEQAVGWLKPMISSD